MLLKDEFNKLFTQVGSDKLKDEIQAGIKVLIPVQHQEFLIFCYLCLWSQIEFKRRSFGRRRQSMLSNTGEREQ